MKRLILITILVFLLGWLSSNVYSGNYETPLNVTPREIMSPSDIIKEKQIVIYEDRIVIFVENAKMSRYANTNSMDPVLDQGANGLQIVPDSPNNIQIGDIITYEAEWAGNKLIVHRVIKIGQDDEGWYAVAKGDNSTFTDPGKIRFDQIKYLLIGVIY